MQEKTVTNSIWQDFLLKKKKMKWLMLYDTPTYTMSVKKFSFHSEGVNNIEKEMEGSH